jgi:heme exporter protein A
MIEDRSDNIVLRAEALTRRFGFRSVFERLDFECASGGILCIAGPNGSGKSTLLRIIAGLLAPTSGKVQYIRQEDELDEAARRSTTRLVSPEANLYDELSGIENLRFFSKVSGAKCSDDDLESILDRVGLSGRGTDLYGAYSSGMKQRLKYAAALLSNPLVLLLDEPTANLDERGKEVVFDIMKEQRKRGLLIFATNEDNELKFGDRVVKLG